MRTRLPFVLKDLIGGLEQDVDRLIVGHDLGGHVVKDLL